MCKQKAGATDCGAVNPQILSVPIERAAARSHESLAFHSNIIHIEGPGTSAVRGVAVEGEPLPVFHRDTELLAFVTTKAKSALINST